MHHFSLKEGSMMFHGAFLIYVNTVSNDRLDGKEECLVL